MKTVYCYLDARRVETRRPAWGGEEAQRRYVLPRRGAGRRGRGDNVLDFETYRQGLGEETPPPEEPESVGAPAPQAEDAAPGPARGARWLGLVLDACATAAIIAFAAAMCIQFL